MNRHHRIAHVSLEEALELGPPAPGNLAVSVFERGSLQVEMYQPQGHDPQTPHARDEVYVVARGTATFVTPDARHPVKSGEFLFVAAGELHRFEDFTSDFAVWVLFYGPVGGEAAG